MKQTVPFKLGLLKSLVQFFSMLTARRIVLLLVDVRPLPLQVRQLHAERVRRCISPQPHCHEPREVSLLL